MIIIDGYEYERKCAVYLEQNGFTNVSVTPGSGDQGIDIIATKSKQKYGIQCKYYTGSVGNKAIQEVYAGAAFYHCDVALLITNSTCSKSAHELAQKTGVIIWENITAIVFQESNEANGLSKNMTQAEKDAIKVKRIEQYLANKYKELTQKYPFNPLVETEVESFIAEKRQDLKTINDKFEQNEKKAQEIYYRTGTISSMRDISPFKTAIKNAVSEYSSSMKRLLDEANRKTQKFVKEGISEYSVKDLIKLICDIFDDNNGGDGLTYFATIDYGYYKPKEEILIAKFQWPDKYIRIRDNWKDLESDLPSSIRANDQMMEKQQSAPLEKKLSDTRAEKASLKATLNNCRQEVRKLKKEVEILLNEESILSQQIVLSDSELQVSQQELLKLMDNYETKKKAIELEFADQLKENQEIINNRDIIEQKLSALTAAKVEKEKSLGIGYSNHIEEVTTEKHDLDTKILILKGKKQEKIIELNNYLSRAIFPIRKTSLKNEIKNLDSEIEKLSAKSKDLDSFCRELDAKKQKIINNATETLVSEIQALSFEYRKLSSIISEIERKRIAAIKVLDDELIPVTEKIQGLENNVATGKERIVRITENIQELQSQIKEYEQKTLDLKVKIKDLEERIKTLENEVLNFHNAYLIKTYSKVVPGLDSL